MRRRPAPTRFMTDAQLRAHFGLTARALARLRATRGFPQRDPLVNRTDKRAVDNFFDRRSGLILHGGGGNFAVIDGEENFA